MLDFQPLRIALIEAMVDNLTLFKVIAPGLRL